jgi:hypothetical protein
MEILNFFYFCFTFCCEVPNKLCGVFNVAAVVTHITSVLQRVKHTTNETGLAEELRDCWLPLSCCSGCLFS